MLLEKFVGSHLTDILLNEELKVSRWDELNDPFEGLHKLENYTPREVRDFVSRWNQSRISKGEPPLELGYIDLRRDIDALNFGASLEDVMIEQGRRTLNQLYRIACFSTHHKNKSDEQSRIEVLMWAHYGNSQRGARIVFDPTFHQIPGTISKVDFAKEPAELLLDLLHRSREGIDKKKKEQMIAPIRTKADVWEYEDEHRIIVPMEDVKSRYLNEQKFEFIPFPIKAVHTVDFGINYPKSNRDQLIKTLREGRGSHIQFRQCARKHNRYEFKFDPIP